jgi:hypothetical protein
MQVFPFLLDCGSIVASLTPLWINHSFGSRAPVDWLLEEVSKHVQENDKFVEMCFFCAILATDAECH